MPACKACGEWFAKSRDDMVLCSKCEMALGRLAGYAVVVTRCKDCRGSRKLNRNDRLEDVYTEGVLWCMNQSNGVWPDDFCSYGEPKF